jgi:hypothetical protein
MADSNEDLYSRIAELEAQVAALQLAGGALAVAQVDAAIANAYARKLDELTAAIDEALPHYEPEHGARRLRRRRARRGQGAHGHLRRG